MGFFQRKSARPIVGLYGKHPTARDFLRLNASSEEMRLLDEWLSGALAAAQRLLPDWDMVYPTSLPVFLLNNSRTKAARCIVGTLAPSWDGMGRQYPLVMFTEQRTSPLVQGFPGVPCSQFLVQANTLQLNRQGLTKEQLFQAVTNLPADEGGLRDARRIYDQYLDTTLCGAAFSKVFYGKPVGQEVRAIQTLRSVCRTIRPDRSLPNFGIRCPLGDMPAQNTALWLGLIQRFLPVKLVPNAIWSGSTLLVYFNKLSTKALTALWRPNWQDDSVCDLSTTDMLKPGAPHIPLNEPLRVLFDLEP